MPLHTSRHTLYGCVGNAPMLNFDGISIDNPPAFESRLKRSLRRFGPTVENGLNALREAAVAVRDFIGVDRMSALKFANRSVRRRAIEQLLTDELIPQRGPDPLLEREQALRQKRSFGRSR